MATKNYKPSGALKKFVEVGKKKTRVIGSVERHLLSTPRKSDRRTDVIHPSAMAKSSWCHRGQYFEILGYQPIKDPNKASMKQLLVFEEGHRIHARWQGWFGDMGRLYGKWYCPECKHTYMGLGECDLCGPDVKQFYNEVPVYNEELHIQGHADGWLKNFGDDLLLEVKSVGEGTIRWEAPDLMVKHGDFKTTWDNLTSPFSTHITQAQIYMKLLELMDPDNHPKEAVFIYESKPTQDVKEFIIPKSDFGIIELFDAAKMIVESIAIGRAPSCNIGGANFCGSCKEFSND